MAPLGYKKNSLAGIEGKLIYILGGVLDRGDNIAVLPQRLQKHQTG